MVDLNVCPVCGSKNSSDAERCRECGITLIESSPDASDITGELDTLLESFLTEGEDEIDLDDLDLDLGGEPILEELAAITGEAEGDDILLESLLELHDEIAEEVIADEEVFECPLCGTLLPVEADKCPNCDVEFISEEAAAEEEVQPLAAEAIEEPVPAPAPPGKAPPARRAPPAKLPPARAAPAKRTPPSKARAPVKARAKAAARAKRPDKGPPLSAGRVMDITIIGTIGAMVVLFFAGGLQSSETADPLFFWLLMVVAAAGFSVALVMAQIRNKALAAGNELVMKRNYLEAIEKYEKSLKTTPTEEAWTSAGVALKSAGRLEEALMAHNTALDLNPLYPVAWVNKGDVLLKMKKVRSAVVCYNNALRLDKEYEVAWNNKGIALAMVGKFKPANECFARAVSLRPVYTDAWVNMGLSFVKLGDRNRAQQCLVKARQLSTA